MDNIFKQRFRGFFPLIIDVETGGTNPQTDALLELAAVSIKKSDSSWGLHQELHYHVQPFAGGLLHPESLAINQIKPDHPLRLAEPEKQVLEHFFAFIKDCLKQHNCSKAVLVGHNAWFDLHFLLAASARCKLKPPLHQFTCIDTASLSMLMFGQTVLAKALACAKISFDKKEQHSALYDTKITAQLFCYFLNHTPWPPAF